jgi:hypothetical protein
MYFFNFFHLLLVTEGVSQEGRSIITPVIFEEEEGE